MPTPTRAKIFTFITDYIHNNNYGPTIREIADAVGCAPSNAHRHVAKLVRTGKITKRWHVARSIQLVEDVSWETGG